jgi:hypothetical protein
MKAQVETNNKCLTLSLQLTDPPLNSSLHKIPADRGVGSKKSALGPAGSSMAAHDSTKLRCDRRFKHWNTVDRAPSGQKSRLRGGFQPRFGVNPHGFAATAAVNN